MLVQVLTPEGLSARSSIVPSDLRSPVCLYRYPHHFHLVGLLPTNQYHLVEARLTAHLTVNWEQPVLELSFALTELNPMVLLLPCGSRLQKEAPEE